MKKKGLLLFSIIGIVCLFLTTGCGKTAIDGEEFKVVMDQKEYRIIDGTDQFSNLDYIEKVYIALSSDSICQIEFYKFTSSDEGKSFFGQNKSDIEEKKGTNSFTYNVSFGNYSKYTLANDTKYYVVSRIGDTAIYVDADIKCKDDINTTLDQLGY